MKILRLWLCFFTVSLCCRAQQYYQMLSPGHLKNLQKAGLTAAETQYFFNTRKTIFNMGSNGRKLTSAQVAAAHALYPECRHELQLQFLWDRIP